ncbi:hypothetical protein IE077_002411 [Cardiosporidium cionae]|uniref:Uncharacterized protein n=1 Tax=Cardiosporidium cionae TaxID=476202 RepID=A0ABQ7JB34_9APIC|nr:hypothetical protein IE077_002411 [Cardiosporidium cionae]|eukprot:KAF8821160.1 hypothetical protein IE077_002411 [Cardiosporidium cionae]
MLDQMCHVFSQNKSPRGTFILRMRRQRVHLPESKEKVKISQDCSAIRRSYCDALDILLQMIEEIQHESIQVLNNEGAMLENNAGGKHNTNRLYRKFCREGKKSGCTFSESTLTQKSLSALPEESELDLSKMNAVQQQALQEAWIYVTATGLLK